MFIITYTVRTWRNLQTRRLPDHVGKLAPAPSYDEPFEEVDRDEAPLNNDTRPKTSSISDDHRAPPAPAPNIAP